MLAIQINKVRFGSFILKHNIHLSFSLSITLLSHACPSFHFLKSFRAYNTESSTLWKEKHINVLIFNLVGIMRLIHVTFGLWNYKRCPKGWLLASRHHSPEVHVWQVIRICVARLGMLGLQQCLQEKWSYKIILLLTLQTDTVFQ